MPIAFFVSSLGDTDLAKATIAQLVEQPSVEPIFIIPLTKTAADRTENMPGQSVRRVPINEIVSSINALSLDQLSSEEIIKVTDFISKNNIERAYVGVPSANNEIPFQIANALTIPCTIAYEYMFKPKAHRFFDYAASLTAKKNCDFAVPLHPAATDLLTINSAAKVYEIGHLSLDRLQSSVLDSQRIRHTLLDHTEANLIFVAGSTQPIEVDNQFLEALLKELSTGKYPTLQLRMGIHGGVKDPGEYLQTLLQTCEKYPQTKDQFKIILTTAMANKVGSVPANPFILRCEVIGPEAAQAADKVTQAVPGALLNEAALSGKPSYFHDQTTVAYLPKEWFSSSISQFFGAKSQPPHTREELKLNESAPIMMAKLMTR